jgi:REP element-mobilizing transposase RayT
MEHAGWHSRGYLPHFDSEETIQFVTFRLADSLPKDAVAKLQLTANSATLREKFLDQNWGSCWLRTDAIASIVEQSLLVFDGERYRLHAWTIMPNHVHVLFTTSPQWPLGVVVGSWKRFTALQANRLLGRTGAFWQLDYWDRFIRNDRHFADVVNYIDLNPMKAGLVAEPHLWRWGSARRLR